MSENTKFAKQLIVENFPKVRGTNALSKPVTSNSVSTPQESKGVNNTKTRRPQPRSNTKHDRVPCVSKSSRSKNKEAEVEDHHKSLLLFKNNKHIPSACNNIKIDSQDVISKVVCAMCKKCLISVNHDKCLRNFVNGKNSSGKKQKAKVSVKEIQMKYQPKFTKPKKVGTREISKGVNNAKVIAPGMFRISPDKVSREAKKVPNTVSASSRTKSITVSQPSVITKKGMNSNSNGLSSTGLDNTKTRRPQPRINTKNDRVPSASKSS
nr:hypothetical protein [Tanacetum cinerariifolium]